METKELKLTDNAQQRRRDERRPEKASIHCYLDGIRFDACTQDISAGGAFLLTDREIQSGSLVAVAFKHQPETNGIPVFLLAQVVRHQAQPQGAGVRWVKASTRAPRLDLARFLAARLQVAPQGLKLSVGPDGVSESEYDFQVVSSPSLSRCSDQIAKVRAVQEDFSTSTAAPVAQEPAAAKKSEPKPAPEPGPMTDTLSQTDTMARARIRATVEFSGGEHKAIVVGLGQKRISVACRAMPPAKGSQLVVRFELPGKGVKYPITWQGKANDFNRESQDAPVCLLADLDKYDEGGHDGVLTSFIRWLYFRTPQED